MSEQSPKPKSNLKGRLAKAGAVLGIAAAGAGLVKIEGTGSAAPAPRITAEKTVDTATPTLPSQNVAPTPAATEQQTSPTALNSEFVQYLESDQRASDLAKLYDYTSNTATYIANSGGYNSKNGQTTINFIKNNNDANNGTLKITESTPITGTNLEIDIPAVKNGGTYSPDFAHKSFDLTETTTKNVNGQKQETRFEYKSDLNGKYPVTSTANSSQTFDQSGNSLGSMGAGIDFDPNANSSLAGTAGDEQQAISSAYEALKATFK